MTISQKNVLLKIILSYLILFQSPPGCKLKVHSADSNGYTLRYETACYHYCEVMYKTGHFEHGQRLVMANTSLPLFLSVSDSHCGSLTLSLSHNVYFSGYVVMISPPTPHRILSLLTIIT